VIHGVGMEFRILGSLDVYLDGELLDVGSLKQRTVLAALLVSANEPVSVHRLMDSVWWEPPAAAGPNLRSYLAGLRRVLRVPGERESRLQTIRAGGYRLNVLSGELDLQEFEGLARRGERALRNGCLSDAAGCLERAQQLWRGRGLDGVVGGPGLKARVTALEERRLEVVELWAQARLDLGLPQRVATELRVHLAEHPLRERMWTYLMIALCRSGRQSEALVAYAELRAILAEELGADPGPELQRLHERIIRGESAVPHPLVALEG
jgi:DNA-binding SARP family transcriptional activator